MREIFSIQRFQLESEVDPPRRPPRAFLNDFFRVHFVEYAFLVLYAALTVICMFTVVEKGLINVWAVVRGQLAVAAKAATQ